MSAPWGNAKSKLSGTHSSVDMDNRARVGAYILSKDPIDTETLYKSLSDTDHIIVDSPNSNKLHQRYRRSFVKKEIENIFNVDMSLEYKPIVRILTTYLPDVDSNTKAFKDCACELSKIGKELRVEVIFTDPDERGLIEAKYRHQNDFGGSLNLDEKISQYQNLIQTEAKSWSDLDKLPGFDVEVRLSKSWPAGMCIQIGERVVFLALMHATESAIECPMIEIRDRKSTPWERFEEDFRVIWQQSKVYNSGDIDDPNQT